MSVPSLKGLLLLRVLPPLLLALIAGGVLFYFLALRFANQILDQSLYDSARALSQQLRAVDGRIGLDLPKAASDVLEVDALDRVYFRVTSARFGLIAGAAPLPLAEPIQVGVPDYIDSRLDGEPIRVVALRLDGIVPNDRAVVEVAETLHKRDRLARQALVAVVVPQLVLVCLAGLLVFSGVRFALEPLRQLERAVHARSPDDLSRLSEQGAPSEVRPLTSAINALLGRLEKSLSAQQRFIADAAHQLRTPLAALKVQIERALREREPESREGVLLQLRESIDRTVRLSNQLLLLARAEPGSDPRTRFSSIDLRAFAFDIGSQWVPRALAEGADFGFDAPDQPVPVRGDPLLLGELINNLVDNSLKYGGPQVRVTLQVSDGARPTLVVEDSGPGIPEMEREQVLERFHRVPGSSGSGSGLGLAIVREIASAHGAELELGVAPGGGLLVRLRFPPAAA